MHAIHPSHTSLPPLSVQQCLPVLLGGSFFLSQRVRSGYNGPLAQGSQKLKRISSDPVACDSILLKLTELTLNHRFFQEPTPKSVLFIYLFILNLINFLINFFNF
jgi:hypothetical protein